MTAEFDKQCWRLSGPLTVSEVPDVYVRSVVQRDRAGLPVSVHLEGVEKTDSSALALLLEWASWARREGSSLEFLSPPDSLRVIAALSDADELLGWPSTDEAGEAGTT